jgi:MoxR-like ATPase
MLHLQESGAGEAVHKLGGVAITLARPYQQHTAWIGNELPARQLSAAWMRLSDEDLPMNPRLVGKPGVGKTTLAVSVGQSLGLPVYLMQATADTRPEDLIVTPVVSGAREISYVASPLVTAMIVGGVCVLDEGNRMSEKSWASLAALLDHRRYVDSIIAGVRVPAHREFRFVTTMNDDASVFDLPEYIQSRLNPQIVIDFADAESERQILQMAVPYAKADLLDILVSFLAVSHQNGAVWSVRDGIQVARYAARVLSQDPELDVSEALLKGVEVVLGVDAGVQLLQSQSQGSRPPLRPV